jgi:hypothetical protein
LFGYYPFLFTPKGPLQISWIKENLMQSMARQ